MQCKIIQILLMRTLKSMQNILMFKIHCQTAVNELHREKIFTKISSRQSVKKENNER